MGRARWIRCSWSTALCRSVNKRHSTISSLQIGEVGRCRDCGSIGRDIDHAKLASVACRGKVREGNATRPDWSSISAKQCTDVCPGAGIRVIASVFTEICDYIEPRKSTRRVSVGSGERRISTKCTVIRISQIVFTDLNTGYPLIVETIDIDGSIDRVTRKIVCKRNDPRGITIDCGITNECRRLFRISKIKASIRDI